MSFFRCHERDEQGWDWERSNGRLEGMQICACSPLIYATLCSSTRARQRVEFHCSYFSANGRVCNRQGRSRGSTRRRVAPTRTSLARTTNPSKEPPRRSLTPRRRQRLRRMTNPKPIAARRPPPRRVMARRRRQGTRRNLQREPVRPLGSPARIRTSVRRRSRRRSRLRRRQRLPRSEVRFRYAVGNGSCLGPFFLRGG